MNLIESSFVQIDANKEVCVNLYNNCHESRLAYHLEIKEIAIAVTRVVPCTRLVASCIFTGYNWECTFRFRSKAREPIASESDIGVNYSIEVFLLMKAIELGRLDNLSKTISDRIFKKIQEFRHELPESP